MSQLIYIISPFFGFVLTYVFIGQLVQRKISYWKTILLLTPITFVSLGKIVLGSLSPIAQLMAILFAIYGCIILPIYTFDCPKWKSIGLTMFFYVTLFLLDGGLYAIFRPIFGEMGEAYDTRQILIYAAATWSTYSLLCSLIVLLARTLSMRRFQKFYCLFLTFPLSQCVLLYCSIYGTKNAFWMLGVIIGLVAQIALLINTISHEQQIELRTQLKETQHRMALEQAHYQYIEQRQEELSRIRHDYNNQIMVIGQLIQSDEREEALQLIQSLGEAIAKTKDYSYCNVPVVNAILSEKERTCMEKGIALDVELDIPRDNIVDPMHLCSVFSNLLDNAIHGAETVEKQYSSIHLVSKVKGDYLFIKTENPVSKELNAKSPTKGHGYGTGILNNIAEQYQGNFQTKLENGVFTAVISLLINE